MNGQPRDVRPLRDFYLDLQNHLLAERGEDGRPSRLDFQVYELAAILHRFSTGWDDLPQVIPGRADYRVLISAGSLVRSYAVHGQLAPDGVIELIKLRIDVGWLDDDSGGDAGSEGLDD